MTSDIATPAPVKNYMTVRQTCRVYSGIFETESALRNMIFKAQDRHSSKGIIKGNGLADAIIRVGRKVLIDEEKLVAWISSHAEGAPHAA